VEGGYNPELGPALMDQPITDPEADGLRAITMEEFERVWTSAGIATTSGNAEAT
jgi:hypothetical protein